ncbi:MAG: T9SS type A sorting domain-containing protein [Dysgonamonadaceae bacterium]|nr:T9SS type A sorting domain-containing protein [Dysgonamonadaceae bacterium]
MTLSTLISGMYIVKINMENQTFVVKIVKY